MSPTMFTFVMCIIMTVCCVLTLASGFRKVTLTPDVRLFTFIITTGLAIWGWLIYF
jgi:uncharacterized membrane protein